LKALITGLNGFIGSNLAEELRNQGHELCSYYPDLDVVFHLSACNLVDSIADPVLCLDVNIRQTVNLLERMRIRAEEAVLVFASTGSVYGEPIYSPQDEKHPLQPTNPYAISKVACENYINYYAKKYGLKTVILRLYNVTGKGQRKGVVPFFIHQILTGGLVTIHNDGSQVRCFTHVKDVVRANMLAYANKSAYGLTFNIAGNQTISIRNLAVLISRIIGKPMETAFKKVKSYDITAFVPDASLAKKVLGFSPIYNFEDAITELVEEMKNEV
jgi:UDP-glucose 4-epimerase